MDTIFETQRYVVVVLLIIALGITLSWPSRIGRRILCFAILFHLVEMVVWQAFTICVNSFDVPFDSPSIAILRMAGHAANTAWVILLIAYLARVSNSQGEARITTGKNGRQSRKDANLAPVKLAPDELQSILRKREWTYVLDVAFLCFATTVMTVGFIIVLAAGNANESTSFILTMSLHTLFSLTFWFLKEAFGGKSPAKALTGLQVVDASTGRPIGLAQSMLRNWIFLVPLGPIVELITANVRQDKKRLGDLMANTIVVRSNYQAQVSNRSTPLAIGEKSPRPAPRCVTPAQFIRFPCPACSKTIRVPAKVAGKRGRCRCGSEIRVPCP